MGAAKYLKIELPDQSGSRCIFFESLNAESENLPQGYAAAVVNISTSLFVRNVPPMYSEKTLEEVFSCFGEIERCVFPCIAAGESIHKQIPEYRIAYVVFKDESSVALADAHDSNILLAPVKEDIQGGMPRWIKEYENSRPDISQLEQAVDLFMEAFDENEEQSLKESKQGPVVDEDGFITVRSKKRRKVIPKGTVENESTKKKMKKGQNIEISLNRRSAKEAKKEELEQLQRKFEMDKEKIRKMKESRKFNPV